MENKSARWFAAKALIALSALANGGVLALAASADRISLQGSVSSQQENQMEGVLVSAKKDGSTITVTVVSDEHGHYEFPRDRLAAGRYSLTIRAIGYELQADVAADIMAGKAAQADLALVPTKYLASQLSSAEWMLSAPGTDQQKSSLKNCAECHTLALPMTSAHDATEFEGLIQRMLGTYAYQSQPGDAQLMPKARHLDPGSTKVMADYLASVNLGTASEYRFPLKTLPRVKGRGTHVIITTYDLPRPLAQPHDVIVDPSGTVWYDDFSKQIIGSFDPKTGKTKEYPVPLIRSGKPTGALDIENGLNGKIWIAMHIQAGIAQFDPKTKKFHVYPLPDSLMLPNMQSSQVAAAHEAVDGKIWTPIRGDTAARIDVKTGAWQTFYPFAYLAKMALPESTKGAIPIAGLGGGEGAETQSSTSGKPWGMGSDAPNVIYGIASDSSNNAYGMSFLGGSIVKVDAKTGTAEKYDTQTPFSQPRRGHMDDQDRLWFAQYNANRIGMLDTRTGKITDYVMNTPWTAPYDAVLDKAGWVWTGGMNTDRVVRINTRTGEQIEYQFPRTTNIRRVFVDNKPAKPVFWVGSNHDASVIKVEPLD